MLVYIVYIVSREKEREREIERERERERGRERERDSTRIIPDSRFRVSRIR